MGDSLSGIGFDQSLIQQLFLLVVHIWDQQAEKDMQLLNLGSKRRGIQRWAVQQFIDGIIDLSDLHDVDTAPAGRRDLDKFSAYIFTSAVELMSL